MKFFKFGAPAACAALIALAACEGNPTQACRFILSHQLLTLRVGADTTVSSISSCNTGTPVVVGWAGRNAQVLSITPSLDNSEVRLEGRAVGGDTVSATFSNGRSVAVFVNVTQ